MGVNANIKKVLAFMLAICILFCACTAKDTSSNNGSASDNSSKDAASDTEADWQPDIEDTSALLQAAIEKNSDVVAWLTLPNTKINEAVVQTRDNAYYLRRDVEKNYSFEGCYYMDYESVIFDDGADMAQNTIIYGHNLGVPRGVKDDPNDVKFAQLLKLTEQDFAEQTPYVYLNTPAKQHVYEIFAAFYCEDKLTPVPYHYAQYTPEELLTLAEDAKQRSELTYDVAVDASDKLLTLSTCTYKYGTYSQNNRQRFVVMARLVRDGESFHQVASVTTNPNPKGPIF